MTTLVIVDKVEFEFVPLVEIVEFAEVGADPASSVGEASGFATPVLIATFAWGATVRLGSTHW